MGGSVLGALMRSGVMVRERYLTRGLGCPLTSQCLAAFLECWMLLQPGWGGLRVCISGQPLGSQWLSSQDHTSGHEGLSDFDSGSGQWSLLLAPEPPAPSPTPTEISEVLRFPTAGQDRLPGPFELLLFIFPSEAHPSHYS